MYRKIDELCLVLTEYRCQTSKRCNGPRLHGIWNTTSIFAMSQLLSQSAKRLIACIAGVLVLFCQSVAVANACMLGMEPFAGSSLQQPCHDSGQQPGQDKQDSSQIQCLSQRAAPADAKVSVPAAVEVTALTVWPDKFLSLGRASSFPKLLTSRAEPPPLNILHCRLLI